jgi:tripartite motif-containing protein 71
VHHWHRLFAAAVVLAAVCLGLSHGSTPSGAAASGVQAGMFSAPSALAFDPSLNVYVADGSAGRVIKLSNAGKKLATWTRFGAYRLVHPAGIVADAFGNVYVTDSGTSRVFKIGAGGQLRRSWLTLGAYGKFRAPHGVTIDAAGHAYVADWGNGRVVKLARSGRVLGVLGINQLRHPTAVAATRSGSIYVADGSRNRIYVFQPKKPVATSFGSAGSARGQLNDPSGLVFDGRSLYVSDTGNSRIEKFSATGKFAAQVDGGALRHPQGLAFDGMHRLLFVANTGAGSIDRVGSDMKALTVWK